MSDSMTKHTLQENSPKVSKGQCNYSFTHKKQKQIHQDTVSIITYLAFFIQIQMTSMSFG